VSGLNKNFKHAQHPQSNISIETGLFYAPVNQKSAITQKLIVGLVRSPAIDRPDMLGDTVFASSSVTAGR
jgi:hypothetical protein